MSTSLHSSLPKPQIPSLSPLPWTPGLRFHTHLPKTLTPFPSPTLNPKPLPIRSISHHHHHHHRLPPLFLPNPNPSSTRVSAGRSKKKPPGGPSSGRIEGNADIRRLAKENARRRSRRLAENLFFRHNNPKNPNHPDQFSDDELEMIGLGYDRMVRFMSKDDPNLRHPHDWYKYGRYGPYSWRGIVVGRPIRGRFSDERVTLIGEVRNHEEWEEIERFDMASEFSPRLQMLDESVGFRYFWVFVRHPKWKVSDLPWQQWTLVCEVVLEAGKQRLDKWNLMGRLGNKTRAMITQCAAWMRPDIIYVKRPVYQCRFEPQDDFFKLLGPLIDPSSEKEFLCELKLDEGRVEMCTYFGGLCKIVKISPKAYVDDVVKAYEKLSDEGKSRCLEFLLTNHPMELLHPYTKEWKAKLEELELGCDAPDESDGDDDKGETQITDWIEDDEDEDGGDDDSDVDDEDEDAVIDVGEEDENEEDSGTEEDNRSPEESEKYWNEQWKKAVRSPEAMENLVKKSVEVSTEFYKRQMMEEEQSKGRGGDGNAGSMGMNWQQSREEWKRAGYKGLNRRVKKGKILPELFLRAAVRPFTYRNLVKEIVLMRHAIIDGEISGKG